MKRCTALFLALACLGAAPPVRAPLRESLCLVDKGPTTGSVAFSPDGKRFATAHTHHGGRREQNRSELHVRDVRTGQTLVKTILKGETFGHRFGLQLRFLPDGKTLAALTDRGAPYLFAAETLDVRSRPADDDRDSYAALFVSQDGKALAACGAHAASVWQLEPKFARTASLRRDQRPEYNRAFSPDLRLVAATNHQDVDLWDVGKGKIVRSLLDHRGSALSLAFSDNGRMLAVSACRSTDERDDVGEIRLWEVATGKLVRTIDLGASRPLQLAFSPDGKRIAFVERESKRCRLRLLDAATGREIGRVELPGREYVLGLTFDPTGTRLGSVHSDGAIRVWQISP